MAAAADGQSPLSLLNRRSAFVRTKSNDHTSQQWQREASPPGVSVVRITMYTP